MKINTTDILNIKKNRIRLIVYWFVSQLEIQKQQNEIEKNKKNDSPIIFFLQLIQQIVELSKNKKENMATKV